MENKNIYEKYQAECDRQDQKWGIRNNHPLEWLAILFEEVGEVAMEVNDSHQQVDHLDLEKYETELVQCGAVITQMIKNIELYREYKQELPKLNEEEERQDAEAKRILNNLHNSEFEADCGK